MTLQDKLDQATKSIQQNQQQAQHHANQVLMLQGYIARLQEEIKESEESDLQTVVDKSSTIST